MEDTITHTGVVHVDDIRLLAVSELQQQLVLRIFEGRATTLSRMTSDYLDTIVDHIVTLAEMFGGHGDTNKDQLDLFDEYTFVRSNTYTLTPEDLSQISDALMSYGVGELSSDERKDIRAWAKNGAIDAYCIQRTNDEQDETFYLQHVNKWHLSDWKTRYRVVLTPDEENRE